MRKIVSFVLFTLLLLPSALSGQEATPTTVPDVVGMPLPQAAALLNKAGFRLSEPTFAVWTDSTGIAVNTVGSQIPAGGSTGQAGDVVQLEVLVQPNMRVYYDDNDFTLVGEAAESARFRLEDVVFEARNENTIYSFSASEWNWNGFEFNNPLRCMQFWSTRINAPRSHRAGCTSVQSWSYSQRETLHFWIQREGITTFKVMQDGVLRGICPAIAVQADVENSERHPVEECTFYLVPGVVADDVTEYLYFTYERDNLMVINQSEDRWMPIGQVVIRGFGALGDLRQFIYQEVIGNPDLLAPGQCVLYTNAESSTVFESGESCDQIARVSLPTDRIFWRQEFSVISALDGEARRCSPVIENQRSICLLPR